MEVGIGMYGMGGMVMRITFNTIETWLGWGVRRRQKDRQGRGMNERDEKFEMSRDELR